MLAYYPRGGSAINHIRLPRAWHRPYHSNRLSASFRSAAIRGSPTVSRPVLKLPTIVVPNKSPMMTAALPREISIASLEMACSPSSRWKRVLEWLLAVSSRVRPILLLIVLIGAMLSRLILSIIVWAILELSCANQFRRKALSGNGTTI